MKLTTKDLPKPEDCLHQFTPFIWSTSHSYWDGGSADKQTAAMSYCQFCLTLVSDDTILAFMSERGKRATTQAAKAKKSV